LSIVGCEQGKIRTKNLWFMHGPSSLEIKCIAIAVIFIGVASRDFLNNKGKKSTEKYGCDWHSF
jgi:hypothetical protein